MRALLLGLVLGLLVAGVVALLAIFAVPWAADKLEYKNTWPECVRYSAQHECTKIDWQVPDR
jgi:hypothetical protein